jgi:prevent-host-death family protein
MTRVIRSLTVENKVSKSKFKPQALKYFREVQRTQRELIITERGKPVLKVVPYLDDPRKALRTLRGSLVRYEKPTEPVGLEDWESLK